MDDTNATNPVQIQREVEKVEEVILENNGERGEEMIIHPDIDSEVNKLDQNTY